MRRRRTQTRSGSGLFRRSVGSATGAATSSSAARRLPCPFAACIVASLAAASAVRADQASADAHAAAPSDTRSAPSPSSQSAAPPAAAAYAGATTGSLLRFHPPRAPELAPPRLAIELHTGAVTPLENRGLCPGEGGCVLQSGGGVGGTGEWRWPSGFGAFVGYDLSFFDTDAVFELGVQNALRSGVRYTAPTDIIFHPTFEAALGGHLFGDTFRVSTFGALVQVGAGAEVELSATYCMRAAIGMRVLSHTRFRTARDGVLRGDDYPLAAQFYAELGLGFM